MTVDEMKNRDGGSRSPQVIIENVRKVFTVRDQQEVVALQGIDLTISNGEFVAILGPSGCG